MKHNHTKMNTNKQKKKYINNLCKVSDLPFISEINTRYDFLKFAPTKLYKYRKFDKYSFEMIKENYVFMAPVKNLDDIFDCRCDFELEGWVKDGKLTEKSISKILNMLPGSGLEKFKNKDMIRAIANNSSPKGLDVWNLYLEGKISKDNCDNLLKLNNINDGVNNLFENLSNSGIFDEIARTALESEEKVGICSFSEIKDNKVMWSLYSGVYEGYCVEYEIPKEENIILKLFPVIYTKKKANSFINKFIESIFGTFIRHFTNGKHIEGIGGLTELYCTKDKDWEFQKEWRLRGNPNDHFKGLEISAIYLGVNVKERNEKKMINCAQKFGFSLYKMKNPNGAINIEYIQLV